MSGAMSFDELKEKTQNGEIDTVLSCIVDMQGRLAGKRFHAAHFVNMPSLRHKTPNILSHPLLASGQLG